MKKLTLIATIVVAFIVPTLGVAQQATAAPASCQTWQLPSRTLSALRSGGLFITLKKSGGSQLGCVFGATNGVSKHRVAIRSTPLTRMIVGNRSMQQQLVSAFEEGFGSSSYWAGSRVVSGWIVITLRS